MGAVPAKAKPRVYVHAARPRTALRLISSLHRWAGISLCLLFASWFASGSVLLFVPFPSLPQAERIAHLPMVHTAAIRITPAEAVARSQVTAPTELRLIEGPWGPLYVVRGEHGSTVSIDAASGVRDPAILPEQAAALASRFAGRAVLRVAGPRRYDQWTVHQQFDAFRPFYRVSMTGQDGLELYVSAHTADILQRTHHAERCWNMVGAVVHWIYPTIIRRSFPLWNNLVWCLSLAGVALAASGLVLGVVRSRRALRRARRPALSPYRGLWRWHHLTGLAAGLFLLSWIFSGWLSMDHGRLFSTGEATAERIAAYRGISLRDAAAQIAEGDLRRMEGAGEIELVAAGGHAYLAGRKAGPAAILDLSSVPRTLVTHFPEAAIDAGIRSGWPGTTVLERRAVMPDDIYENLVTEPMTGRLSRVVLADPASTWVEIDSDTGKIRTLLDRSRRLYRWIYYGMHTFDLPGLSSHDTLRRTLILCLLALGESLSLTGVVLGVRRMRLMLPRFGCGDRI